MDVLQPFTRKMVMGALVTVFALFPFAASAQSSVGSTVATFGSGVVAGNILGSLTNGMTKAADAMCTQVDVSLPCGYVPGPHGPVYAGPQANKHNCPPSPTICADHTAGSLTIGTCIAPFVCKGVSTGMGGSSSGLGLDKVIGILGQLAGQLMKGSGSGSGSTPGATMPTTATGCTTGTYITNVVSSDPCAVFVPAAITNGGTPTDNSNVTSALLDALNGTTGSNTSNTSNTSNITGSSTTDILNQYSNVTPKATVVGQSSSTTLNPVAGNAFAQSVNLLPGLKGDISVLNNGATFVVNNRDQNSNTEVAGFYGSDTTLGSQPTGLVAAWCQSRPWSKNFLSAVIPPTFFDSLCKLRGYAVGTPVPASSGQTQVTITQSPAQPVKLVATTTVSTVPLTVDIWASPATVSLGARTSVFWTSTGASSCTVTSPDGSFSQRTLTGGASTVAITAATVFTISCTASDGSHATKSTTVQIAI